MDPIHFGLIVAVMVVVAVALMRVISRIIMMGIWLVIVLVIVMFFFGDRIGFHHGWRGRAQHERPYAPPR